MAKEPKNDKDNIQDNNAEDQFESNVNGADENQKIEAENTAENELDADAVSSDESMSETGEENTEKSSSEQEIEEIQNEFEEEEDDEEYYLDLDAVEAAKANGEEEDDEEYLDLDAVEEQKEPEKETPEERSNEDGIEQEVIEDEQPEPVAEEEITGEQSAEDTPEVKALEEDDAIQEEAASEEQQQVPEETEIANEVDETETEEVEDSSDVSDQPGDKDTEEYLDLDAVDGDSDEKPVEAKIEEEPAVESNSEQVETEDAAEAKDIVEETAEEPEAIEETEEVEEPISETAEENEVEAADEETIEENTETQEETASGDDEEQEKVEQVAETEEPNAVEETEETEATEEEAAEEAEVETASDAPEEAPEDQTEVLEDKAVTEEQVQEQATEEIEPEAEESIEEEAAEEMEEQTAETDEPTAIEEEAEIEETQEPEAVEEELTEEAEVETVSDTPEEIAEEVKPTSEESIEEETTEEMEELAAETEEPATVQEEVTTEPEAEEPTEEEAAEDSKAEVEGAEPVVEESETESEEPEAEENEEVASESEEVGEEEIAAPKRISEMDQDMTPDEAEETADIPEQSEPVAETEPETVSEEGTEPEAQQDEPEAQIAKPEPETESEPVAAEAVEEVLDESVEAEQPTEEELEKVAANIEVDEAELEKKNKFHTLKINLNKKPRDIGNSLLSDPIFSGGKRFEKNNKDAVFVKIKNAIKLGILIVLTAILIGLVWPMLEGTLFCSGHQQASQIEIPKATQKFMERNEDTQLNYFVPDTETVQQPTVQAPTTLPVTIEFAENLFFNSEFKKARIAYNSLYKNTPQDSQNDMLIGFLRMRMGQCFWEQGKSEDAEVFLKAASQCSSPVVKVLSNYYLAINYLEQQKYLDARIASFRTLAMAEIPDNNIGWVSQLELNSRFMAAEATTRYALALCDGDDYEVEDVWSRPDAFTDPFMELNEKQLSIFLTSGSEKLRKAIIAPIIVKNVNDESGAEELTVTCKNTTASELIARTAQNASMEVTGQLGQGTTGGSENNEITLHMSNASANGVISVAAGSAGMLAEFDIDSAKIYDLSYYSSLNEYVSILSNESVSLWRELAFITRSDDQTPGAHFALALLYSQNNKITEALAEYKLITVRFPYNKLAQKALLNSAKLKAGIHDYANAREDLKFLVEQYPETSISYEGLLFLADLTMKVQVYDEACRLYNKVYYFTTDQEAQAKAALGAGKAYCELENYEFAAKWLSKYMVHAKKLGDPHRYSTCYLLGKIYLNLGENEEGYNSLKYALRGRLTKIEHLDTIESLVKGYIDQEDYIAALDVLESDEVSFSSTSYAAEILLLKSSLLRSMGLIDSNIRKLKIRIDRIADNEIRSRALFELGLCYSAKDDLTQARQAYLDAFGLTDVVTLSEQIAWQLAQTCYELKEYDQVFSMCEHIIDNGSDEKTISQAKELLANALYQNKDYNKALAILTKSNN